MNEIDQQIDKDIDMMQAKIEGKCPSCGNILPEDADEIEYDGHKYECIRSFNETDDVQYISPFRNGTCRISWCEEDQKELHVCSKEDYDHFRARMPILIDTDLSWRSR